MISVKQSTVQQVLQINDLPTLPNVMARILSVADDNDSNAGDLTEILSCDPAISARVLRIANSPFYGARYSVDTIRRAIITIGFEAVKQLSMATAVLHAINSTPSRGFDADDFWLHALGAAKASQFLIRLCADVPAADACYTAAVLHDLGKLMLSLSEDNDYASIVERARERRCDTRSVEEEQYHISHDLLGAWILERWSFPPTIVEGVAYQYTPDQHRGKNHKAICVIALCSDLARLAEFGQGGDANEIVLNGYAMEQLNLDQKSADNIVEMLTGCREEATGAVEIIRQ